MQRAIARRAYHLYVAIVDGAPDARTCHAFAPLLILLRALPLQEPLPFELFAMRAMFHDAPRRRHDARAATAC